MRLSISHTTGFHYSSTVRSSYNEARLTPLTSARQSVWSSQVTIEPTPWVFQYTDYWGSQVTAFELHDPHKSLTVQSEAMVETHAVADGWDSMTEPTGGNETTSAYDFARLRDTGVRDRLAEFLTIGARTRPAAELAAIANDVAADVDPPRAVLELCRHISQHVAYEPGATEVATEAAEVWQGQRGVCQDFSHLALGALRHIGIPARYVSGYLHPAGADAEVGATVAGESHAWIEFWCGQWIPYDPTSNRVPGVGHVRIAHGRDYRDVSPLRGTYAGGASDMFVTVSLTRLG